MRHEYKYIVPAEKLGTLRQLIRPFVTLDRFAEADGRGEYTVRSIYFDNSRFDFYFEKIEGIKDRKKLRIRSYDEEDPEKTVFFEIKRKFNIPIKKCRAEFSFAEACRLLRDGFAGNTEGFAPELPEAGKFLYHILSKKLRPVVLVAYEREAWLDNFDKSLRVTFDKNLRSIAYPAIDELFTEHGMRNSLPGRFIMEVKFNRNFPVWLKPIQANLDLVKQAASKYTICIDRHDLTRNLSKSTLFVKSRWFSNNLIKSHV